MEIDNPAFMIIDDLAIETSMKTSMGISQQAMFDYRRVQEPTVLYHGGHGGNFWGIWAPRVEPLHIFPCTHGQKRRILDWLVDTRNGND